MKRNEHGNSCLALIAVLLVVFFLVGSCIDKVTGNPYDDGNDSNDCYYEEPIPHFDECY